VRARGAVSLAALGLAAACVPFDPIDEPDTLAPGVSHLVVDTTVGAVKVYAYDGPLPRLVASSARLDATFVLAYDQARADLALVLDGDRVVLPTEDNTGDPLPPPRVVQRWDRAARALVALEPGAWPEALAEVRIAHARPCPTLRTVPVRYDARRDAQSLHVVGSQVLVGQGGDVELGDEARGTVSRVVDTPRIFRVDDGATTALELPIPMALTGTAVFAFAAQFYRDARGLRVAWGGPRHEGPRTYAMTLDGQYTDEVPLVVDTAPFVAPMAIASAVFDGVATVVMADQENAFVTFDEALGVWRRRVRVTKGRELCTVGTHTQVLEVTGPGLGLVALQESEIRSFDLAHPTELGPTLVPEQTTACRSAYGRLDDGGEVVTWAEPNDRINGRRLVWRRSPAQSWIDVETVTPVSSADLVVRKDVVYVTAGGGDAGGDVIAVFVYDRQRPDLPPRHCRDYPTRVSPLTMVATPGGVLVGGSSGGLEWLLGD
jgi:hypothetical protein